MKKLVLLTAILALLASVSQAQSQKGDTELQLQGSVSLALDDEGQDFGSIYVTYGRFFTDRQEAGVTVAGFISGDGDFGGTGGPFYRYNFTKSDKRVPYVGAALVTSFGDFTTSDLLLNLEVGVRFFLERNSAFTVAGSTFYDVDESELNDTLQILFGFSYFWER